jgi:hypothetical protein
MPVPMASGRLSLSGCLSTTPAISSGGSKKAAQWNKSVVDARQGDTKADLMRADIVAPGLGLVAQCKYGSRWGKCQKKPRASTPFEAPGSGQCAVNNPRSTAPDHHSAAAIAARAAAAEIHSAGKIPLGTVNHVARVISKRIDGRVVTHLRAGIGHGGANRHVGIGKSLYPPAEVFSAQVALVAECDQVA